MSISTNSAPAKSSSLFFAGVNMMVAAQLRKASLLHKNKYIGSRATGLNLRFSSRQKGNQEQAAANYRGHFCFSGHMVKAGPEGIFEVSGAPDKWSVELRSFEWLCHLEAGNRELSRVHARALILNWIDQKPDRNTKRINDEAQARRVIAWIRHAGFILEGAGEGFSDRFFVSLSRQTRSLAAQARMLLPATQKLQIIIALTYGVLGLKGMEKLHKNALLRLAKELEKQIFADGGHISRSPQILAELMNDLLPLRNGLEKAHIEVPQALSSAIERCFPMLRFLSHGDGGLAVFNGVSNLHHGLVRQLFDDDNVCGRPLSHALHSGYARLQTGKILVLMDVGKPPLPNVNPHATLGPLAFEFSDEGNRIVVNCGTSPKDNTDWANAARATAAHSTMCLGDRSAGRIYEGSIISRLFNGNVLAGPGNISCDVSKSAQGALVTARHNAYGDAFGTEHERQLFVDKTGRDFRGQDSFIPVMDRAGQIEATAFAIRFHLHPGIKASLSHDAKSVLLVLSNKSGWRFSARGAQITLEESIFMPVSGSPRKSAQIVLRGNTGAADRVIWAFKRVEEVKKAKSAPADMAPKLL